MADRVPITTLLSQVLIAFTIEFDNEFERQLPHRTTTSKSAGMRSGPWLVSQAMWSNFMRFVDEDGVTVREFASRAFLTKEDVRNWLTRMAKWWGYIGIAPDPADGRPAPPRADWLIRPTAAGRHACKIWAPLSGVIEQRWETRFGRDEIDEVRESLRALVRRVDVELPEYPPVLGFGFVATQLRRAGCAPAGGNERDVSRLHLSALLAQVLLAFTLDFERESDLSLALSANVLRVLSATGVRVRELPALTGVSKEAVGMSVGFLEREGSAEAVPDPTTGRGKLIRLTAKGRLAQDTYRRLLGAIEERWQVRVGQAAMCRLRASLSELIDRRDGEQTRLSQGLVPWPGGWRARKPYLTQTTAMLRDPGAALPHYPMVLHRGGWPDGS